MLADAQYLHKYDSLVDNITKKELDAAYDRLRDKIKSCGYSDVEFATPAQIKSNQSGDVYMQLTYNFTHENGQKGHASLVTNVVLFPTEIVLICAGVAVVLIAAGVILILRHRKKKSA